MIRPAILLGLALCLRPAAARGDAPFEGRIEAVATRGGNAETLRYRIGPETVRIEVAGEGKFEPVNLVDLKTGALTVLYPHNASFTRKPGAADAAKVKGPAAMPVPGGLPGAPGASAVAGIPAMPPMPTIPATPGMTPAPVLKPMGKHQKLLGYDCECFEISERGETVEIWATAALVPFQKYVRDPLPHFGPRSLDEMWSEAIAARQLFPLRAVLHDETPDARTVFEVKTIAPGKIAPAESRKLFQMPENYAENPPRPF